MKIIVSDQQVEHKPKVPFAVSVVSVNVSQTMHIGVANKLCPKAGRRFR